MKPQDGQYVAFHGTQVIGRGDLAQVALCCKERQEADPKRRVAIFDEQSGHVIDVNLSGSKAQILGRLAPESRGRRAAVTKRGPGRPKLGVVSREVSLLPRHWEWLSKQRGGASVTLRRLVEAARVSATEQARIRDATDAAHRFIWDMAGNQRGFEEATRALFRHDFARLSELTETWPEGIREQLARFIRRAREADA